MPLAMQLVARYSSPRAFHLAPGVKNLRSTRLFPGLTYLLPKASLFAVNTDCGLLLYRRLFGILSSKTVAIRGPLAKNIAA